MQRMGTKARMAAAFLLALLITAVYFAFAYTRMPFIYDINDDVAMRNVAAGVITGTPDAHLIFVKYVLGILISGLYRGFPGWDWYGIVMIGIILFSLAVILYRGLAEKKSIIWKIVYTAAALLLFTCIGLRHIAVFQWTVTAAFAGVAGIFLFYTSTTEDRFQNLCEEGVSVFLLLLCLSVRDSVFMMVLPAAALCFWWRHGSFRWEKLRAGKWPFGLRHWGVLLALILAERYRVLYLNMEGFSGFARLFGRECAYDLSDLLYFGSLNQWKEKKDALIQDYKGMKWIAPVCYPEDRDYLTGERMEKILNELLECGEYDKIVIDIADHFFFSSRILDLCHEIYIPVKEDAISKWKLMEFDDWMERSGRAGMEEKIRRLHLPHVPVLKETENYLEQLMYGEMADYVRRLVKGAQDEELER